MLLLTEEQKRSYDADGFVLLDNVFTTEEVDEISAAYDSVFARALEANSQMEGTWSGDWQRKGMPQGRGFTVHSIHNLQYHDAVFLRLLTHRKLLDACSDVMNTENILLHHTKAHVKPPGRGSPYPMHQDYHYFPFRHDSMVAVFIHLDDSDISNGCLAVYPGSHRQGPQTDCSSDPGYHHVDQTKFPLASASPLQARRGQVLIFSYLLVHGSYANLSERARRMLLIQVRFCVDPLMAAEDEPLKAMHVSPSQGLCLRGANRRAETDIRRRHLQSSQVQEYEKDAQ
ncbi:phytanoyl-CoA dioxygenase, peroxisomal-like [Amphibalanus amphitrite]|uniref:phytanoyl-CoA dioxygenase, peroxisomal-like n=1 Tax=Amphibalanus amphitrite TaxID=1232801 RepID=UPI001C9265C5|nr:phytanoyl-CoA dioxygenase, peroxisomal-like [Amphibalanus amphitrite]